MAPARCAAWARRRMNTSSHGAQRSPPPHRNSWPGRLSKKPFLLPFPGRLPPVWDRLHSSPRLGPPTTRWGPLRPLGGSWT
eukprot:5082101-Alexandrium_andersonii.AAC.1